MRGALVVLFSLMLSFPAAAQVVTSFSILGDLASRLVPGDVRVVSLVKAGEDTHQHEGTAADLKELRKARLVFAVGAGFEPWLKKAHASSGSKGELILLTEGMELREPGHEDHAHPHQGPSHRHPHGGQDPHVWLDVAKTRAMVARMARALREAFPGQSAEISRKEKAYDLELNSLQEELKKQFSAVPADRRLVITSHDAFGYFGAAQGLRFLAPQGWSTEVEPSAKQVARLIRQIREHKVKALFVENLTNRRSIDQISGETGVKVGGTLYADSLSDSPGPAADYVQMMKHNARTILDALK
ncbi:MAG: zinc ABC transporter substrate-binding protein [Bdellovibrionaceae bacterium]|nr:zinc ABC transporter substrate-binding protein [Pseudobdellovibrionaceae bacterium]